MAPVFCFCSLRLAIFSSSSFLTFSCSAVHIKTCSPNFTTVSYSSFLISSSLALFSALWLNSLRKPCHAFSSSVFRNIPVLPSKEFFSLTSLVKSTIRMLGGSLARGSSRFLRETPKVEWPCLPSHPHSNLAETHVCCRDFGRRPHFSFFSSLTEGFFQAFSLSPDSA